MYHELIIAGALGGDPDKRFTPSGQVVTNFSVAANRRYNSSNGELVTETVWFRVSAWGRLAETCAQYLHKGSKVLVTGRLRPDNNGSPRTYQRQDGSWGASYEVNASNVRFLTSNASTETNGSEPADDEEIPF
jgi:single-strand DNA-binding protein